MPEILAVAPVAAIRLRSQLVVTAGSWERAGESARFVPRFPPVPGTAFALIGRADEREAWRELAHFELPDAGRIPSAVVESIDPAVDEVPANLLRLVVRFSGAMDEGSAAGNVRLLDENGDELAGALLEMPPELWDRNRRRLTVLLEPGRIKRGLQPNLQAGAPLREGGSVTLVVGSGIRDADGAGLVAEARRTFRVGPAIRSRIDPGLWDVRWPQTGDGSISVRFDRPLDRALVQRYLDVVDPGGNPVAGTATFGADAREWAFTPVEPGFDCRIRIDARLEDLAGNSVRRVFDRDLALAEDDGIDDRQLYLSRPQPVPRRPF